MPKNKKPNGVRMPSAVLNAFGVWVGSKFAGKRIGKNSTVFDSMNPCKHRKRTHTSPVVRTIENSGVTNPTRIRHANTKRKPVGI